MKLDITQNSMTGILMDFEEQGLFEEEEMLEYLNEYDITEEYTQEIVDIVKAIFMKTDSWLDEEGRYYIVQNKYFGVRYDFDNVQLLLQPEDFEAADDFFWDYFDADDYRLPTFTVYDDIGKEDVIVPVEIGAF